MADEELPFRAEYAKSGRAGCKGCKENIPKETLRMAAMVQSPFFDGKQAKWYHYSCFFNKQRPASVADIAHFESLRFEDQEKIRQKLASAGADTPKNGKAPSAAAKTMNGMKDFQVEYAKGSGAKCQVCEQKVVKGEPRIGKRIFDNDRARSYGAYLGWHHVDCFVQVRTEAEFYDEASKLPGFKTLSKEHQHLLRDKLAKIDAPKRKAVDVLDGAVSSKKSRSTNGGHSSAENGASTSAESADQEALKKQSKAIFKYRDSLKQLNKRELQLLLEENEQAIPSGAERMLDLLSDVMMFGALLPCTICKDGGLYFRSGVGYQCRGNLTEWTKCINVETKPKRCAFRVPQELAKEYPFLKRYKCKVGERVMAQLGQKTSVKETEARERNLQATPLHGLQFVAVDGVDPDVIIALRRLDAKMVKRVSASVAAVVCTKETLEAGHKLLTAAEKHNVHVIPPESVAKLKAGSVFSTIDDDSLTVVDNTVADRLGRTEQQIQSERQQKSAASRAGVSGSSRSNAVQKSSSSGKRTVRVKGGAEVDPDSGLEHRAHVYRDDRGDIYSAVLCQVDAASGRNSYYRLQVLVADGGSQSWLFRAWGRLGTTVGGNQLADFPAIAEAKSKFCQLYEEKSGNRWEMRKHFQKIPGRFYPMDLDFGDSDEVKQKLSVSESKSALAKPVQQLICSIFDVDNMRQTMLEFEIDMDKMPLGKLSRRQMEQAYHILTEAQDLLNSQQDDNARSARLLDCSNRFFTLVPHNFGLKKPPLLDNLTIIKEKVDMVSSLMDIELAYSIHRSAAKKSADDDDKRDPIDMHYRKLKTDISVLEPQSRQYQLLRDYVQNTHASTHSGYQLTIENIFCVSRHGETARYKPFSRLPNRKLLWHGSRITNYAGILSQGLRIAPPEAPVTGYMFGKGIYFADMVSKSANYCFASRSNPRGVLLLCEVALGNMYERKQAEFVTKLPAGKHSTKGIGKTHPDPSQSHFTESKLEIPLGKSTKSDVKDTSLLYNEYIIYDTAQCQVQYLLQVKFEYK